VGYCISLASFFSSLNCWSRNSFFSIQAEGVLQKNMNEKTQLLAKLEDLTSKNEQLLAQNGGLKAQNNKL
jgi:hypothetical protein